MGIFCLEIKGGEVRREEASGSTAVLKGSRSPFEQAKQTTYPIIKTLEKLDRKRRNKFVVGWGVVFPDIVFDDTDPAGRLLIFVMRGNFLIILKIISGRLQIIGRNVSQTLLALN